MMRWAWYGCILFLGLVTTGAELDVMSRKDIRFAASVPAPFRNYAQERIAEMALIDQDPQSALAEARTLVRRRPIPTESLFVLASAYQLAGNERGMAEALNQGTARGWRHPVVDQVMIATALQNGDTATAAAYLLALWSIDFDSSERDRLTREVLAAPGGAEAYGKLVATSQFMQDAALRGAFSNAPAPDFARMAHAAITAGAHFDCNLLARQATTLTRQGNAAQAALLAAPGCPSATPGAASTDTNRSEVSV